MNEDLEIDMEINGKTYHTLNDLKELPTGMLTLMRDNLLKEKLKTQKSYKLSTVTTVLGGGCLVAGILTGTFISSCIGGFLMGRGVAQLQGAKIVTNFYDQIVSFLDDEISYREFGKELFPEFYPDETPKLSNDYNELLNELLGL